MQKTAARKKREPLGFQLSYWGIFLVGLIIMAAGIAMMIRANLGCDPWDVFHIGLFKHLGLTVGTWSIIVGLVIVLITCLLTWTLPTPGAVANMIFLGVFIDIFLGVVQTPGTLLLRWVMMVIGLLVNGTGIAVYIAANRGAGPRDTLMLFLMEKTKWKLTHIRRSMEVSVLIIGWILGGPVSFGTVFYGLTIGSIVGKLLPVFQRMAKQIIERGAVLENINKGPIRTDHHDGAREESR